MNYENHTTPKKSSDGNFVIRYSMRKASPETARLSIRSSDFLDPERKPEVWRFFLDQANVANMHRGACLGKEAGKPCALIVLVRRNDVICTRENIVGAIEPRWNYYRIGNHFELIPMELPNRCHSRKEIGVILTNHDLREPYEMEVSDFDLEKFFSQRHPHWLQEIARRQIFHWEQNKPKKFFRFAFIPFAPSSPATPSYPGRRGSFRRTLKKQFPSNSDTVRVWVAGCATGEEAYSIAILLSEHAATLEGPPQLQVFATDLDEQVIREAREGLYPETIAADVSEERLRRFFIQEQGGYRVRRAVRELVLFAPHDLLKDSPFSRLDLVSCRNLLIYLKKEAQSRAFDIFHFALRPGGRLFLGTSEAVDESSPLFVVLDKKHRLYIQRPGPQRLIPVPVGQSTLARALALQDRTRERPTIPGRVAIQGVQAVLDQAVPFDIGLPPGELHYRLIERFSPPSILVNSAHDIVHLSESAGRFLQFTGGEPTRNLMRTVNPMLRVELRAALYAAAQTHTVATAFRVLVETGDTRSLVDIRVTPAGDLAPDFLLVAFEEHPAEASAAVAIPRNADADQAALHLERELVATKAHLRFTIEESEASTEELKASNEELQAMNEELRSATEELEASREELQSVNEELTSVNDALKSNVDELSRSNSDLQNLMAATDIATVFLDRELRIQRFTPSAKTLFNFIPGDLGRPLSDLSRQLDYPEIVADAERSLAHLQPAQREVRAGERWYIVRTLPYRTADDHIAGVVLTFIEITERKESEEDLRQSEARKDAVLRIALDAIVTIDQEGNFVEFNPAAEKIFGYARADVIGRPMAELIIPPRLRERHHAGLAHYLSTGEGPVLNRQIEVPALRADGTEFPAELAILPVPGSQPPLFTAFLRDITGRKAAEEALRESEERSAFVRRSSGVGFWYCDLPFDVLEWDELVKAHFHLPPDAFVTVQTFYDRMHPDDREPIRQAIELSIAERTPYDVHYRTVDPDSGAVKWVRAIARTSYAADGTPIRFDGVTLDVSDQKRAEASLRESEQRFRVVADAAPVLIWLSGTDKLCYWFNKPWLEFTGRSMSQEAGNGWAEGVHPDDFERCLQVYITAFDAREAFSMEYRLRRHDGEFRWLIDNGVPRYTVGGEFDGYIGSCLDVTDYKNAEAGLRQADRRKDEFLATLAHELRNPLAPIRNGLQVMRLAGVEGLIEKTRTMMERQLTQLVRLVDDLLDVNRVTSGKFELRREQIELRAVIDAAVETSRPAIEQAGHKLEIFLPDEPILVDGDPTRLAQIISNLLTNSAKYTYRGGRVRLTARCEDGTAELMVEDNGIGIPPDMLGRVFEMFTQVDRALEKTTGGLGIGLSLVKGLVEMHGGTIEARSEGEGRGSEFIVRLPVVSSPVQNAGPPRVDEPVGASSCRILITDDNVDSAESLGMFLEILGNEVSTANDGLQALEVAEKFLPEVILLDIGMPKLNGYEACRRIREQPWGNDAILIAMTGWGQDEDKRRSQEAGFDHHLVKPVEPAALQKLLASLKP